MQARRRSSRVCESAICHLEDRPGIAPHAHQRPRRRERKFDASGGESVIGLGFGVLLHEGREVSGVIDEFLSLVVNNICGHVVQESTSRKVRTPDTGMVLVTTYPES